MTQPRRCPYCGEVPIMLQGHLQDRVQPPYQVACGNMKSCRIRPRTNWWFNQEKAVDEWNTMDVIK